MRMRRVEWEWDGLWWEVTYSQISRLTLLAGRVSVCRGVNRILLRRFKEEWCDGWIYSRYVQCPYYISTGYIALVGKPDIRTDRLGIANMNMHIRNQKLDFMIFIRDFLFFKLKMANHRIKLLVRSFFV